MLSIIVAKAKNNVIGKDNQLIWHIPEDLKRFKKLTTNKVVIMGRKTFESIGKPLQNRKNVILSHSLMEIDNENIQIVNDVSELGEYIKSKEECFVIGGAIVYRLLMPYVTKMYITKIHEKFDGDAYFPMIDINKWKEIKKETIEPTEENNFSYDFITYKKK